jgi:hypothetical protein
MREQIIQRLKQQPFLPFRLRLSNGSVHDIRHPELALVSPYYVILGTPAPDLPSPAISDSITVAMIHIAEIEPAPRKTEEKDPMQ